MTSDQNNEVTVMLHRISEGSTTAADELLELVYDDLRRLAGSYMQNERGDHTLQATALVHEAYIRLVNWENVSWKSRAQFFSVAATVMRRVLVDHARAQKSLKRDVHKLVLDDAISMPAEQHLDLIVLEDALFDLEKVDPRQAKIVELRFFGGLSIEETAFILNISETTVRREWTFAKTWFQRELSKK